MGTQPEGSFTQPLSRQGLSRQKIDENIQNYDDYVAYIYMYIYIYIYSKYDNINICISIMIAIFKP